MHTSAGILLALLLCAPAWAAGDAQKPAHIYRWVDQNGVAHYTTDLERVPVELRNMVSEPQPLVAEPLSAQAPASVDAWVSQDRPPVPEQPEAAAGAAAAADPQASQLATLDKRIAELEAAVEADEAALKQDITSSGATESNDALKAIAARLPARLEELKKLRAERDQLAPRPE